MTAHRWWTCAKRPGTRQHFVDQHPGRENVGARIDLIAAALVPVRHKSLFRKARLFSVSSVLMNPLFAASVSSSSLARPKIQDLYLARISNHDVAGLDVAMNDAARVGNCERVRHLNRDSQSGSPTPRPSVHQLPHVPSFDVLHRDKGRPLASSISKMVQMFG